MFEACHGPITPEQQQLLELEAQIAAGVLYCATWKDKPIYVTECFCIVAQASMGAGLCSSLGACRCDGFVKRVPIRSGLHE